MIYVFLSIVTAYSRNKTTYLVLIFLKFNLIKSKIILFYIFWTPIKFYFKSEEILFTHSIINSDFIFIKTEFCFFFSNINL